MRQMRRRGLGPFGLNLALALLAAGAIVSLASAPAAQSPPAGPPPFAPPAASGTAALDGGAPPADGGSPIPDGGAAPTSPVAAPTSPPPVAPPTSPPPVAPSEPSASDGGPPEGGPPEGGALPSEPQAPSSAPQTPPASPASAEPGPVGSGRIFDPTKIYVSIPVALGVSASVNFAMGIAFTVLSNAKVAKTDGIWREIRADGGPGACNKPAFAARCDELYGADSDRQTYRDVAILSYVGAVGFAVGAGVSYFILFKGSEGKGSAGGSAALVVDIKPSGGGAAIKGTF